MYTLVAFVVRDGLGHLIVAPAVIVTVYNLAEKEEIGIYRAAEALQLTKEIVVETISYIKTQTVNGEFADPISYTVE